ncbi:MAG: hypothetical protein IT288_15485 [Bdellovibrionales bacterium]|nr:hypothetical protein [Bdellovibrionales bacterium]
MLAATICAFFQLVQPALSQAGECAVEVKTSSQDRLSFERPASLAEWTRIVGQIRTDQRFPDGSFNTKVLLAADSLNPHERQTLVQLLMRDYRTLKKEPNRRMVDLLFARIFRPDLRFRQFLGQGLSVAEAYQAVMTETTATSQDLAVYRWSDIKKVAGRLQSALGAEDVAYLVGSSPQGRGLVGRSDLDLVFEHRPSAAAEWLNSHLPWSIRRHLVFRFQEHLRNLSARTLQRERSEDQHLVEVRDFTPGNIFSPGAWVWFGVENNFVVVIRQTGVELAVFAPPVPAANGRLAPGAFQLYRLQVDEALGAR